MNIWGCLIAGLDVGHALMVFMTVQIAYLFRSLMLQVNRLNEKAN